jgi:quercetin dioxygenase-like cupin family protein
MSGKLVFKLDDDMIELGPGSAVRVAPEVARSVWNEAPEDAELIIVSKRIEDPAGDSVKVDEFWPE